MITFSKKEIEQYNLNIPSEKAIQDILDNIERLDPKCSSSVSGSQITPTSGCSCSYTNFATTSPETCGGSAQC